MVENIQSLSICCPSATGKCINHCKTCTARQHANPYENKYDGCKVDCIEYWEDVIKRMKHARDKGCSTLMLTGSNEPQQNRRWLEGLYLAMKSLPNPFNNVEIQTTGAFLDRDFLKMLKLIGVTTVAVSAFNVMSDEINRDVEENADKNLNLQELCDNIYDLGMNVRICVNVTDEVFTARQKKRLAGAEETEKTELISLFTKDILTRCSELHASQVTFRKMWANEGTSEAEWIHSHEEYAPYILSEIKTAVKEKGALISVLPYGAARYDYMGFSIVIDTDSMAKDTDNAATKYYIIRENGKMYSSWDSAASLVF